MRLKQLTNLNTLLLLTVCLALGITLWWSQRAMERPFQLLDQYLELSQRFDEQVARNIRQYLGSGDAVRQQAALQALESLAEALPELPPDLARTLAPSLAELREFSAGDLLAAGKLAATRRACCYRPSATSPATWNNGPPTWTPRRGSPRPAPTAPRCCSPACT